MQSEWVRETAGGMRLRNKAGARRRVALLAGTALVAAALAVGPATAQDATWLLNPGSGDFNTGPNWNPALVPTGTAFFGTSNTTALSFSAATTVGGWTFNAGASAYTFTNGQFLTFNGAGIVVNGGSATITNNNNLNFNGTSTAGSAAITNSGNLIFNNCSTAGSATIANNNFVVLFQDTSTAGSATITNTGDLSFENTSTASSATITNNNNLNFNATSTAGSATITNNNFLNFFGTSTAGSAAITNNSGGTVDFSGSTGPAGDNKLSAGSIAGAGNYDLGVNELTVGSNNLSTEVSGDISGVGGSLVKTGAGTLTLAGVNTYTGATTVNAGTLAVNSSIITPSGVTVNAGGTLGGTGTVGATTIMSGGSLAPGNSIGTITVNGNLTFNAGSTYLVEVSPTAADRTNVTGTATLTGGTVQALALPGSFTAKTYTILNATGGFGGTQFAGLTATGSFSPARNPHLTYDANNVFLVLDPGAIVLAAGATANQAAVAGGINNAVTGGATPPAGFDTLLNIGGAQLGRALDQVSGEPGAGSTQASFNAANQFLNLLLDPFNDGSGGVSAFAVEDEALGYASARKRDAKAGDAYAAVTPRDRGSASLGNRWNVWASGYGGSSTVSGNAATGSHATTSRIYGTAVGAGYRVSPDTLVGFALGGAGFNFGLDGGLGGGRADLFQAGVFARHTMGAAYVSAALAYGWQDVTTDRTVTVSGTDMLRANFKANTFAARAEAGTRFVTPFAGITPYAALQVTSFMLPSYGETATAGSDQFALSYASQTTTNVRTELGARADKAFLVRDGIVTLRTRAAWAHDSNTDRAVSPTFQSLPGSSFTVNGARPSPNSALVTAGAEMKWKNGWSVAGAFDGEFSRTTAGYAGKGTVKYAW